MFIIDFYFRGQYFSLASPSDGNRHSAHDETLIRVISFELDREVTLEDASEIFLENGLGFLVSNASSKQTIVCGKDFKPPLKGKDEYFDDVLRDRFESGLSKYIQKI